MVSRTESVVSVAAHGGLLDGELVAHGIAAREVLDVSVNVNPYGPSAAMREAISGAAIDRYPDPTSQLARLALATSIGADASEVVLGNGAVDLLWTIARIWLDKETTVVIVEPTFSELRRAATLAGARVVEWRAREETSFRVSLEDIARIALRERAALLYLCAPGNPTGTPVSIADVASFARDLPDTVIVLDQAFLSVSAEFRDVHYRMPPNVVCVRSLTKDHAIPGVRVGYLLAPCAIAARIEAGRPPWSTSAPAQAATLLAARDEKFVAWSRERWLADRARLATRLSEIGLPAAPSSTPYVLVRVARATDLRLRMLVRHRVLVRDCSSFGLPNFVRLCGRPEADEDRLVHALKEELRAC